MLVVVMRRTGRPKVVTTTTTTTGRRPRTSRCSKYDKLVLGEKRRLERDGVLKRCDLGDKRRRIVATRYDSPSRCCFRVTPEKRQEERRRKRKGREWESVSDGGDDLFDSLPEDVVISVLSHLSSTASSPSDLVNVLITCKRLNRLGLDRTVLSRASSKSLAVSADRWSESAHRFLKMCVDCGNLDACYMLGMIHFYCLGNRRTGASMMAKAAMGSHAEALYSLAIIQFNGSGGSKLDKDVQTGFALCARAATLNHVDALRELGHCLRDGYGVRRNETDGHKYLIMANALELSTVIPAETSKDKLLLYHQYVSIYPSWSDFGCHIPPPDIHPANRFLVEWFSGKPIDTVVHEGETLGLRLCCNGRCGRPETRKHEFRRCSICGVVNYCSRSCQAIDWRIRHKAECVQNARWLHDVGRVEVFIQYDGIVENNGAAAVGDAVVDN